jgi:hypothetical protein
MNDPSRAVSATSIATALVGPLIFLLSRLLSSPSSALLIAPPCAHELNLTAAACVSHFGGVPIVHEAHESTPLLPRVAAGLGSDDERRGPHGGRKARRRARMGVLLQTGAPARRAQS